MGAWLEQVETLQKGIGQPLKMRRKLCMGPKPITDKTF